MRRPLLLLLPALLVLVTVSGNRQADDDFYAMRKNFEIFGSFYEELVGTYHLRIDPERFMRTGIDAMLTTLDPWTDFLDEADHVEMDLRGRRLLGDVGLSLGRRDGRVTVLQPDQWSGAYRQGVRTGDVVVTVDGQPVDSLALPDVYRILRGEPGTVVEVSILRADEGEISFSLRREAPVLTSVSYVGRLEADPDIVYMKLDVFGNGAAAELASAYRELTGDRPARGVILDLRGNPGGLLSEAIGVSNLFLAVGSPVVSTRGRTSETNVLYRSESEPVIPDAPLTVLMDGSSASASEIVAGALQDLDRAVIIGEPSFGKGLVQVVRPLVYSTSLKVTMSSYYTPSGRGIRKDHDRKDPVSGPGRFSTAAGRPIREGQGIEPEVPILRAEPGPLETRLEREAAFFLYGGEIARASSQEIMAAAQASGTWTLPDHTYDGFRAWLRARGFVYLTPLEESLADVDVASAAPSVRDAMERLRSAAEGEREDAFRVERARILQRLTEETAAHLLEPDERVRALLHDDRVVDRAREVLRDEVRYRKLLTGN